MRAICLDLQVNLADKVISLSEDERGRRLGLEGGALMRCGLKAEANSATPESISVSKMARCSPAGMRNGIRLVSSLSILSRSDQPAATSQFIVARIEPGSGSNRATTKYKKM